MGVFQTDIEKGARMSFVRRFVSAVVLAAVLLPAVFAQTPQPSASQPQQQQQAKPKCSDTGTYVNSKGETVKRPENCFLSTEGSYSAMR
jgi:hypothetical protein